ncbi:MAG TPA: alpha/beta hydrolase [Burkholderiales bacterium]|nr:alpha/beta hydrolase [Burkholderiales bacterium]
MKSEPIVLLHCSGSSGAQWRTLAPLLGARYRVMTPDLIGYGAAAPWSGRGGFSLAQEAAAVRSLLGRLDEPAHLVGHSYGGAVALHIARTCPERVRSLTLVEPSAFHLLRNGDATDLAALREIMAVAADASAALAIGDYGGGFGRFVDYWSGPGSWAEMAPEKRTAFAPQLAKVVLDFHALLSEPAELEDVCDITLPTLLVQGGCTTLPSRCVSARLRMALPEATFRVVQGAGHMLPVTHRDQVNALIADHVQANSPTAFDARPVRSREPEALTI